MRKDTIIILSIIAFAVLISLIAFPLHKEDHAPEGTPITFAYITNSFKGPMDWFYLDDEGPMIGFGIVVVEGLDREDVFSIQALRDEWVEVAVITHANAFMYNHAIKKGEELEPVRVIKKRR